ncbi:MAG: hypothetical protein ACJAT2_002909 [Bacteriovoracaceae bacterium]|jgi:hypothetical protein
MKNLNQTKDFFLIVLIVLGVTGLFYLNNKENPAMLGFTPHPYFVISILISAFYGFRISIFTSLFSAGLYFLLLNSQLDYDEVETILDFEFISMPLSMVFISMLVGELKQRTIRDLFEANLKIEEKEVVIENNQRQMDISNQELSEMKQRLVSKLETLEEIYDIGLGLFRNNIDELFPNFLVILHKHLDVEGASIYIREDSDLNDGNFKLAKGFPFTDEFEEEINAFSTTDILFRKAYKEKSIVTIKDVTNKEEYESWAKQTIISMPVVVSGDIHAIVNIHKIPFLKYTPTSFKKFKLLVQWLGHSLQYALNYEGYSKYSVLDETLHIFKNDYFLERLEEEMQAAEKIKSPLAILKIKIENYDGISEIKKIPYRKLISDACLRMTRKRDCVAEGTNEDEFFLSIPNLDQKGSLVFKERIQQELDKFKFLDQNNNPINFDLKSAELKDGMTETSKFLEELT